jgi:cytoplasmic iron level regulating protein YaaA (DUF328/UPF0246 family)
VIVVLPPSETKRAGGDGPAMELALLGSGALNPLREALVGELIDLAADPETCRRALGISAAQDAEIGRNAALRTSATMPAIHRYTGVLYDALDFGSLRAAEADRARSRLAIGSALFGLLRAGDPIPAYRLSAGAKLPGRPGLAARWRPLLEPVLADLAVGELIVDLRSGAYVGLGRVPGAIAVDVVSELPDGRRTVVTHFNKAHKGRLARVLATAKSEPGDAAAVATLARRAGMQAERDGDKLTIVIPPAR